jgi:DNA polymerase-3 subunit gamma/tau
MVRTIANAFALRRIPHATMLTGVRGVGKTTTARLLARALNYKRAGVDHPSVELDPPGEHCQAIMESRHPDVFEMDAASRTGIGDIREILDSVRYAPVMARYKVYIIDEVHMLSTQAFNGLLKTLEEPPPHVKFIFATTDAHKVLPTVVSRCQRYDLKRIAVGELLAHLKRTVAAEKVALSDGALMLIAREAEGSLRDAQSLLDQVVAAGGKSGDDDVVREVLGAADRHLVVEVVDGILAGAAATCLERLGDLYARGYDAQRFCRDLLEHFRHLAVLRATGERKLLAELTEAEVDVLVAQAERRSAEDLQRFFGLLLEADEALSVPARTVEPQMVLEMCVLRLATLPPLLPVDEILRRLDALGGAPRGGAQPAPATSASRGSSSPATTPIASADSGDIWGRLLARVRQEKVSLYMTLAAGKPLGVDKGVLRIGIENEAMRRELGRKDTIDRLRAIAGEVAGRDLDVEVGPVPAEHATDTPLAREKRRHEETLADPMVQAAKEIFVGAEVRAVRDRNT